MKSFLFTQYCGKIGMIISCLIFSGINSINAQEGRAHSVYLEAFGAGAAYSANYDVRFAEKQSGFGLRAGVGYHAVSGSSFLSVPVLVNFITGRGKHFFEAGIGASFISFKDKYYNPIFYPTDDTFLFDHGNRFWGMMNFGYRKQPVGRGFIFRAGISPVFGHGSFIPYWPYVSIGYKF
ncbi:MAG: hypothetical protein IPI60_16525 [Saprospiraceae bacterium]|nr:hypothetical protein [Saprospiraceae bacterium]